MNVSGHSIGYGGPAQEKSRLHLLCRVHKGRCSLPYELLPLITVSLSAISSELHKISDSISIKSSTSRKMLQDEPGSLFVHALTHIFKHLFFG